MATLTFLTSVLTLSIFTYCVNTQQLHSQMIDLSKYGYNIHPIVGGQNVGINNNYARNIPLMQNQQIAHDRAGYNFGNNYGGVSNNIPLYTQKKVTTIRKLPVKKQPPKYANTVPPFKPGQLDGGKSPNFGFKTNNNKGFGNQIQSFGNKGQNNNQFAGHVNWVKGQGNKNNNFNNIDFATTVNNFNKQIEQINLASFGKEFKQERTPRFNNENNFNNGQSFNQNNNKQPFDYIPVNLDSKINNYNPFSFNTDLKINNNNGFNSGNGVSGGYKPNTNFNIGWNQNKPTGVKSEPVKYETFVPGVSNFDASSGKIINGNSQNFESFHGQGKGGDPSSFVKVTNGDITYTYQIRHLPNRH